LLHPLAGSRPSDLLRTLLVHRGVAPRYAGQVTLMFLCGLARSPFSLVEAVQTRAIANVSPDLPPIFIVGHWRSGTTFLHNLMSRDAAFCFPTITDALRPYCFFPGPFEFISRKLLLKSLPALRPMDDIPMRADLPQEDEIALASMGAPSFFNCFYFPQTMARTFNTEVLLERVPAEAEELWRKCLRYYLAKVAALSPGRRLLLKNPAHSARIGRLRALFPGAKFIHIHRDPFEVVASTRKLYRRLLPLLALQPYDPGAVDQHVVDSYERLMDRLSEGLAVLPAGDLAEIRYQDLVGEPVQTIARTYASLGLNGFQSAAPAMSQFARSHVHAPAPADISDQQFAAGHADRLARFRAGLGYGEIASAGCPSESRDRAPARSGSR
jgi:hypothetical protein